jgi:hypothetical protein
MQEERMLGSSRNGAAKGLDMKNERLDCGSGCSSKASRYPEVFKSLGNWRFYLALPTNLSHKARLGTEAQSCNAAIGIREVSKGQSLPSLGAKYNNYNK